MHHICQNYTIIYFVATSCMPLIIHRTSLCCSCS